MMPKDDLSLPKMILPKMNLNIREWKSSDFDIIKAATTNIKHISRRSGISSKGFQEDYLKLYRLIDHNEFKVEDLRTAREIRAFSYILVNAPKLAERMDFKNELITQILNIRNPISKLSLMQFIRAFFMHFDCLFSINRTSLNLFLELIKSQLKKYINQKNDLAIYAKYAKVLFDVNAPINILKYSMDNKQDLDISALELKIMKEGRLFSTTQKIYYIETLKEIELGKSHPILSELCKENVRDTNYKDGYLLGHKTIEILIDRTYRSKTKISPAWQNAILTIAGDPRVPKSNELFQKWWTLLGEERIRLMRNWLSGLDLKIFLRILEQSARDKGDEDMERMFTPRKTFMEGLLKQDIIQSSRLFLTKDAENYLKRHYSREQLPSYARVNGHASIIYLNLHKDGLHMVEGTHSFSVRLMNKLPEKAYIDNYNYRDYESYDLGKGLELFYAKEFGNDQGIVANTHDVHLNWQNSIINILKDWNVKVDINQVLPKNRIREYKEKFGA